MIGKDNGKAISHAKDYHCPQKKRRQPKRLLGKMKIANMLADSNSSKVAEGEVVEMIERTPEEG